MTRSESIQATAAEITDQFDVSQETVEDELDTLVHEYKVPLTEAEQSVRSKFGDRQADSADSNGNPDMLVGDFDDILEDGESTQWGTVEVTVQKLFDSSQSSDAVAQSGIIGDQSGTVKFKSWAKSDLPALEEGESYRLEGVVNDPYNGSVELKLNSSTAIIQLDEHVNVDDTVSFGGLITALKSGSGLIKRCPREDCNRVLENGRCPEHGEVDGNFDIRLKLAVDTGHESVEVITGTELTASLTGISIEDAEQMAMDALDTSVVAEEMANRLIGQFVRLTGTDFDRYAYVEPEDQDAHDMELVETPDAIDSEFAEPTSVLNPNHDRQRNPAVMVTPTELNHATHTFKESDDERAPNFCLFPSGVAPNRVVTIGVLTETEDVGSNSEYWQGRVTMQDTAFVYAGEYQPEAMNTLSTIEPPAFVAVVGKPNTWTDDDGETNVAIRPERIVNVSESSRNVFASIAASRARQRLNAMTDGNGPAYADKAEAVYGDALDSIQAEIREAIESIQSEDATNTLEF